MKKRALLAILTVLFSEAVSAACKSEACKRATSWKSGYTAIVLDDRISRDQYFAVMTSVKDQGGAIAIEADGVLLGWLPKTAMREIRSMPGVRKVTYAVQPTSAELSTHADSAPTLAFFNRVVSGDYEDLIEDYLAKPREPLTSCVRTWPGTPDVADSLGKQDEALTSPGLTRPAIASQGRSTKVSPEYWFKTPFQNPDMRGRVTVQLFRVDSNGSIDPNLYTWTYDNFTSTRDEILGAFSFWASQAAARNITLSFRVSTCDPYSRLNRAYVPTPVRYEPLTHGVTDDYLWMNDALATVGYGSSSVTLDNVYLANEAFNRSKKADPYFGPFDRSFTIYVVYNPIGSPSRFADHSASYAYMDGPHTTILWRGGVGPITTHETGHIFWACDEATGACNQCKYCVYRGGPRGQIETPWITNGNCPLTGCDVPHVECVMDDNTYALCPHTPQQVGW